MLHEKIYFKLGPGVNYFIDKTLKIELGLVSPLKSAGYQYYHFMNAHMFESLYFKKIVQITEAEYYSIYPPTKHLTDTPVDTGGGGGGTGGGTGGTSYKIMFADIPPTLADGNDGDFYFYRFGKGIIFEKVSGEWVLRYNFSVNHKLVIPFDSVSSIDVEWTSDLQMTYGEYPQVQVWAQKPGATIGMFELQTVSVDKDPYIGTVPIFRFYFTTIKTGVLVIS